MSGARVGRLRLVASHEDDVRRGAIVMADALRIASIPAARSARHYVVRRFDVGRFGRDAASQTVALAIERRIAQVEALAVRFDAPAAADAPAVWFDDEPTALAELAAHVVAGPAPTAWFWRALAGGAALREPAQVVATCLAAAAQHPAGLRAVAQVVDRIERVRAGAALAVWPVAEAERWLTGAGAVGEEPPAGTRGGVEARAILARLAPAWRERVTVWVPRWPGEARAVRLVALALTACGAAPSEHGRLVATCRAIVAAIGRADASLPAAADRIEAPPTVDDAPAVRTPPDDREAMPPEAAAPVAASPPSPAPADAQDRRPAAATEVGPAVAADTPSTPARRRLAGPAPVIGDAASTVGGLLFLLRPLALLGLPAWIDDRGWAATSAFAARLLTGVGRAHGAAADDPLIAALSLDEAAHDPALDRPRWRGGWERRLARWLRAHTELSLAAIVQRPALVAATATHIDVAFALRTADIRVRLAGLDLDPGWVPWLGRVVHFHYVEGARS